MGPSVGLGVGLLVGLVVGLELGLTLGLALTLNTGVTIGLALGLDSGDAVGVAVPGLPIVTEAVGMPTKFMECTVIGSGASLKVPPALNLAISQDCP